MSEDIAPADAGAQKQTTRPTPLTHPLAFTPVPREKDRSNGWKPEVQRAFIEALADSGSVTSACRAVRRSTNGAYHLRRQPGAESFAAAWDAAVDLGLRRIEDTAMDRALYGVEVPVYSYGKLVGARQVFNDRLLMFMLRNRAPERFAGGKPKGPDAVGKMERRRLKKKWRKQWEEALPGRQMHDAARARQLIDDKLEELRQRVLFRRGQEWRELTPETREAYRHYEALRARDLGRDMEMDKHLASEEEIAVERAEEEARWGRNRNAGEEENCPDHDQWSARLTGRPSLCEEASEPDGSRPQGQNKDSPQLPPPGWGQRKVEEEEESGPRVRTIRDDGWS